ncbi:ZIP1 (YDR285W) [Zygosaccharomyces parabailii]|nr:ZIP1 (YDR285W) [Zygosaccharomyces parabailii]CDH10419.1 uncharacterized protein ZBAI_02204 [Zygosaccharomyces bailii ISA1307]
MSNFFRDNSLGFKPRSNVFSKLRVKETESQNENSNTQECDSTLENLFLTSNRDDDPASITDINSDIKIGSQFQIGSSTPMVVKNGNMFGRGPLDEDDLEITEVRDVAITEDIAIKPNSAAANDCVTSSSHLITLPINKDCSMDTSSNDVLLEAFTNTQKICSNLKQELHRVQTENSRLKSQMKNHQHDKEKIEEKFSEYKTLLDSFGDKSKALFEQKRQEDIKLKEFKENYEKLVKKVEGYRNDVKELKANLSQLKFLKKDSDLELTRRIKEIEYLKRDLDACSGQLSEEKLKNSSLVQEFGKIRMDLKESFSQGHSLVLEKFGSFEKNVIGAYRATISEASKSSTSGLAESVQAVQNSLIAEFKFAFKESNKIFLDNQESQQQVIKQLHQIERSYEAIKMTSKKSTESQHTELNLQTKYLKDEMQKSQSEYSQKMAQWIKTSQNISRTLTEELQKAHLDSSKLARTMSREYKSISEIIKQEMQKGENSTSKAMQQLIHEHSSFFQEIRSGHAEDSERIKNVIQQLTNFKDDLSNSRECETKIADLQAEISFLQLQKSQAISALGTKEAQYEDTYKNLMKKETEILRFQGLEKELQDKIEFFSTQANEQQSKYSRLKEENITLKANSENKLVVQNEMLKAFQAENDSLKHRTAQLEEMRQHFERENSSRLDKIQKSNEQLQKLNVEMVQLKAHELELEEENRNLKKSINENQCQFEETSDDFKRLRQRVIVLESDKQDIVSEKMDLHDQIEKLKGVISNLKKKVALLQRNEEHYVKRIEHEAAGLRGREKQSERQNSPRRKLKGSSGNILKSQPPGMESETRSNFENKIEEDEFDLSSSLNDDLELTNPSPIKLVTAKRGDTKMRPPASSRKKLLLLDESDSVPSKHRWKKRRI